MSLLPVLAMAITTLLPAGILPAGSWGELSLPSTDHLLVLLMIIHLNILAIFAVKSSKSKVWVFPITVAESAWATLSMTHLSFQDTFSLQSRMRRLFSLPYHSSVTHCQATFSLLAVHLHPWLWTSTNTRLCLTAGFSLSHVLHALQASSHRHLATYKANNNDSGEACETLERLAVVHYLAVL